MNQLAVSLAGHDKDSVYAVVAEEGSMVLLADGRTRTLEKPKKRIKSISAGSGIFPTMCGRNCSGFPKTATLCMC